jgi:hypothetical protein
MLRQLTAGGIPWPINEANRLTQFGRTIHEDYQIVSIESCNEAVGGPFKRTQHIDLLQTEDLGVWTHRLIRVLEGSSKCM